MTLDQRETVKAEFYSGEDPDLSGSSNFGKLFLDPVMYGNNEYEVRIIFYKRESLSKSITMNVGNNYKKLPIIVDIPKETI